VTYWIDAAVWLLLAAMVGYGAIRAVQTIPIRRNRR
jgi:hypothetical protein